MGTASRNASAGITDSSSLVGSARDADLATGRALAGAGARVPELGEGTLLALALACAAGGVPGPGRSALTVAAADALA